MMLKPTLVPSLQKPLYFKLLEHQLNDEGANSSFFLLVKYNTSNFEDLFTDCVSDKKQTNKLLIEVAKMNEIINVHKTNTFNLEKENLKLSKHIGTLDLNLARTKQENYRLKELAATKRDYEEPNHRGKKIRKNIEMDKYHDDTLEHDYKSSTSSNTIQPSNSTNFTIYAKETISPMVGKTIKFVPICHHCDRKG